eukprot:3815258-Rhodomonas_salina.1
MSYILNGYVGRSYWMSSEWHPLSAAWSALSFPMSPTCALTQTMRVCQCAPAVVLSRRPCSRTERMSQCCSSS